MVSMCVMLIVSDPDHVPVCDQPHEPGIPGRERPAAPARAIPEGETGQEKHCAMRRHFF